MIREASYFARQDQTALVTAVHVQTALRQQVYRSDLVAEKIRELVQQGTLLISLDAPVVGQINALTVADLGDYSLGWPVRLTASAGVGHAGVVNIERESRLSGRTFDKGMLILEGYLRHKYAAEHSLALSASLAMEQTYGGVDGDSATAAELCCLLSAIAGVPLRQEIAITGSVNQRGEIQAAGGVIEKVEGFYDICQAHGLTGRHGVCLPAANVQNLVLRPDVVEAIVQGKFHLWPIEQLDQGLELLTGLSAGDIDTPGTLHAQIATRLQKMAHDLKHPAAPAAEKSRLALEQPPPSPPDPRPPLPSRYSPPLG